MASRKELVIDNRRPEDETYPKYDPSSTAYNPDGTNIWVETGQYIINRDGYVMEATTSNTKWKDDMPLSRWNRGFFRAKYIGNEDDSLECANQCRLATDEEIKEAKGWTKSEFSYRIDTTGQLLLI